MVLAGLDSYEASLLSLQRTTLLLPLLWSFLCVYTYLVSLSLYILIFLQGHWSDWIRAT